MQHGRGLVRNKSRHHHDLAARKFQRVMMDIRIVHVDLTAAGDVLFDPGPAEQAEGAVILHVVIESDLGAGKESHRHLRLADRAETARDRFDEIGGNKLVSDFGRSRGHQMKAVIAHGEELLERHSYRRPPNGSSFRKTRRLRKCSCSERSCRRLSTP